MPRGGKREGAGRKPGTPNKITAALRSSVQDVGYDALNILVDIMNDENAPHGARAQCAQHLADRAFGKARQAVDVSLTRPLYVMSAEPLSPEDWASKWADQPPDDAEPAQPAPRPRAPSKPVGRKRKSAAKPRGRVGAAKRPAKRAR